MTKKHNPKKKRAHKQATPSEIASAQHPEPVKPEPIAVPTHDDEADLYDDSDALDLDDDLDDEDLLLEDDEPEPPKAA
jgi:hypothetical protein